MQLLLIHADYLEFEVKEKALKSAKEPEKKTARIDECLVVFSAVEKSDESNKKEIARNAVQEITQVAKEVGADRIVLYPYVHLTREPSSPEAAEEVLDDIASQLKLNVERVPFGYYKSFTIKCKGHPLSELSRSISAEKKEREVEPKEEDGVMKEIVVILPSGKTVKRAQLKKDDEDIENVIKDELGERKSSGEAPPHLKLMQKLEIASVETRVSDAGNLRYFPKGEFVVELLRDLCWDIFVKRLGGMPTKTPCIIMNEDKGTRWMMGKFPERLYKVLPGKEEKQKELYLRPACDYGALSMFKDATISHKNLPLPLYEFEDNSWRYEQRGELLGMYRVRSFMMGDLHTMCSDLDQAFREYERQIRDFAIAVYKELGFKPAAIVLNCKEDFFKEHKKNFVSWSKKTKLPIVVKLFKTMKTYKVAWVDVVAFDNLKRSMEITTVQLDTETPKYWDIMYTDKDNKRKYPLILHTGIGIERTIAALLENAASEKNPIFPVWLSPTQVRLCPITDKDLKTAEKIAGELEKANVRVDIDDTSETTGKKVRNAEMEWVPMIIVVGGKERKSAKLPVRFRTTSKIKRMTVKQIGDLIAKETAGKPFRSLPLPRLLTKRPVFVG